MRCYSLRLFLILIIPAVLHSAVYAQLPAILPYPDSGQLLAGEHTPLLFEGNGVIQGAGNPLTTPWMQVGYAPLAGISANRNIGRFNPEYFTAAIKLAVWGSGDSAQVSSAWFECAYDTTAQVHWNGDSSNVFITENAYLIPEYGIWRFETMQDTSRVWSYPLRVLSGGYLRLTFGSSIEDTCAVDWKLVCEH